MGELDDKETPPAADAVTTTTDAPEVISIDEPKETEKLLSPATTEALEESAKPPAVAVEIEKPASNGTPLKTAPPNSTVVEIPETTDEPKAVVTNEGREVKPKKIPIGGIKMPGFFTKSKPKPEGDGADDELLEKNKDVKTENGENPPEADAEKITKPTEEKPPRKNFLAALKIRNPFAKRELVKTEDVQETPDAQNGNDSNATDKTAVVEDAENPPPKKGLLNAIRLPIVNIIPKKLRPVNASVGDLESGNGPKNKAGLASMETLDDSLRDTDNNGKDVTDKAVAIITDEDCDKTKLTEKQKEKEDTPTENEKKSTLVEEIRNYECSIDDWTIVAGVLIFIVLVCIIAAFTMFSSPPLESAPIREGKYIEAITSCGSVEGIREDSAFAFRGIPYANSVVGDQRFRHSELIQDIDKCWNGTLNTHFPTAVCWQKYANGSVNGVEDCLTLDVVTPHVRYDNPLPVVVLIGAESFLGDSPGILRPSARYSRARDVIFVRPNFRLGALGLLALDVLSPREHPPTSGNYALNDIINVLKWVQLNIVHFGGNPREVTLFGHRAGATLVSAIVTSKSAKGLFARSWISSGSSILPSKPLPESERANNEYKNQVNCEDAKCLLDKDGEELFEAIPDSWHRVSPDLPSKDENTTSQHEWLVMDGVIVQAKKADAIEPENSVSTQIVYGTTKHVSHSEKLFLKHKEWTPELVKQHIDESKIGQLGLTEEALKRYNATYAGLSTMLSDIRTLCPLMKMAREQKAAFYVVTQVGNGDNPLATVDDDVLAILGRYEPKTPEQRRYVSTIQQIFYTFVSQGLINNFESKRPIIDIGQDPFFLEDYPNCEFWISSDVVPRFAHID